MKTACVSSKKIACCQLSQSAPFTLGADINHAVHKLIRTVWSFMEYDPSASGAKLIYTPVDLNVCSIRFRLPLYEAAELCEKNGCL